MSLLRITAGIISQPASGSPPRPPWPTGPSLRAGYSVPLISATTARSASLARTPWLHLIGLYRRPCPTTWSGLRTTPSLLWVSVPSTRAVTSTPGGESGPYPRPATLLHGLPHQNSESAPPMFPTSASVGALLSTLLPVFALLRPARLLALLDRSDLERHRSPAAEDFFTRAFPRKVTLPASRISLHGARGRTPWPDFHRLEHCRYRLRVLAKDRQGDGSSCLTATGLDCQHLPGASWVMRSESIERRPNSKC